MYELLNEINSIGQFDFSCNDVEELFIKMADTAHVHNDACNARSAVCATYDVCGYTWGDSSGAAWNVREYKIALEKAIDAYSKFIEVKI